MNYQACLDSLICLAFDTTAIGASRLQYGQEVGEGFVIRLLAAREESADDPVRRRCCDLLLKHCATHTVGNTRRLIEEAMK